MSMLRTLRIFCWTNRSVGIFDPSKKTFRKNNDPYFFKGTSDAIGILPGGQFLAIEFKSKRGQATPEQNIFLQRVRDNGGVAFIARGIPDVLRNLMPFFRTDRRFLSYCREFNVEIEDFASPEEDVISASSDPET